jgi:hypothetical protein
MSIFRRVAVFCGSKQGTDKSFTHACILLASALHHHGLGMVYGGGNIGLMGILADEMLRLKGEVIGVIPQKLVELEVAHSHLTALHIVPGMHERKAMMADLSDAFIILPGGIGTMDEFFDIYTWLQLGYHNKPVAILNTCDYYRPLINLLSQMVQQDFLSKVRYDELIIGEDPLKVVQRIIAP